MGGFVGGFLLLFPFPFSPFPLLKRAVGGRTMEEKIFFPKHRNNKPLLLQFFRERRSLHKRRLREFRRRRRRPTAGETLPPPGPFLPPPRHAHGSQAPIAGGRADCRASWRIFHLYKRGFYTSCAALPSPSSQTKTNVITKRH